MAAFFCRHHRFKKNLILRDVKKKLYMELENIIECDYCGDTAKWFIYVPHPENSDVVYNFCEYCDCIEYCKLCFTEIDSCTCKD